MLEAEKEALGGGEDERRNAEVEEKIDVITD
jgi:hypothetical protein